jgi:hypothetical protein
LRICARGWLRGQPRCGGRARRKAMAGEPVSGSVIRDAWVAVRPLVTGLSRQCCDSERQRHFATQQAAWPVSSSRLAKTTATAIQERQARDASRIGPLRAAHWPANYDLDRTPHVRSVRQCTDPRILCPQGLVGPEWCRFSRSSILDVLLPFATVRRSQRSRAARRAWYRTVRLQPL